MSTMTRHEIHEAGVQHLCKMLLVAGYKQMPDHDARLGMAPINLPARSFSLSPRRRVNVAERVMPRDMVVRATGEAVSLKIYASRSGAVMSSLYRSLAYMALSSEHFVQILTGYAPKELDRWFDWIAEVQSPSVDLAGLGGIRSDAALIQAIAEDLGVSPEEIFNPFRIARDERQGELPLQPVHGELSDETHNQ